MSSWNDTVGVYNNRKFVSKYIQHNLENEQVKKMVFSFVKKLPVGSVVVDLGCGHGRDARYISDAGVRKVIGLDYSPLFVNASEDLSKGYDNVEFIQGDMRELPFEDGLFDGVWCLASILSLNEQDAVLAVQEIYRILKVGGFAYISTKVGFQGEVSFTNPDYVEDMEFTQQIWDKSRFKGLLEKLRFEIIEFEKGGGNPVAGEKIVYWGNFLIKKV